MLRDLRYMSGTEPGRINFMLLQDLLRKSIDRADLDTGWNVVMYHDSDCCSRQAALW